MYFARSYKQEAQTSQSVSSLSQFTYLSFHSFLADVTRENGTVTGNFPFIHFLMEERFSIT